MGAGTALEMDFCIVSNCHGSASQGIRKGCAGIRECGPSLADGWFISLLGFQVKAEAQEDLNC